MKDQNKESISTSIEVPTIELQNQEGNFTKYNQPPNILVYQKAAELIANNLSKSGTKVSNKNSSNSHKILRSTSRGGKSKKSKMKKGIRDHMHRKSKSDAKRMANELLKNSSGRTYKANPKMRKSNYVEKIFKDRAFMHKAMEGKESPLGVPPSYVTGQKGNKWIENINLQIEQNGKNLLNSINKIKQKNS